MRCPICNVNLQMTEREGISIDYCPQCRGVWLDRGELEKIIDRSTARESAWDDASAGAKGRVRSEDYEHRKYQKKSFWREIFDFD